MSIRAYARSRGVSHVAVMKATKTGRILLEADGSVDPAKVDAAMEHESDLGTAKPKPEATPALVVRPNAVPSRTILAALVLDPHAANIPDQVPQNVLSTTSSGFGGLA